MKTFEEEIMYGISIDGAKPCMWSKEYPSVKEIEFNSVPQCKSIEIVEMIATYEVVGKVR